jgi:hypothetical protein
MHHVDVLDNETFGLWSVGKLTYLVPDCMARADGRGPIIDLNAHYGKLLVLTLEIKHVIEQERLIISVWGSEDMIDWGTKPLIIFPRKHYCGIYSTFLNLARYPKVRYLRAEWNMSRWGKADPTPMFRFYVSAEESGSHMRTAIA